ncbi:hypothetical protein DT065_12330 [Salicibibacter kimchii]|uniref:Uncharacterized protein n=1 Tax=Salicibibacter kimchii TaxID=2099786 RepID=A0A345C0I7_9BACI|nr:hypothetical protein DT065_12330 [Salicibibacter kimchii]
MVGAKQAHESKLEMRCWELKKQNFACEADSTKALNKCIRLITISTHAKGISWPNNKNVNENDAESQEEVRHHRLS